MIFAQGIAAHQPRWLDFAADHLDAGDFGLSLLPHTRGLWRLSRRDRQAMAMHAEAGVQVPTDGLATDLGRDEHGFRITLATGEVIGRTGWTWPRGPSPQRFGADGGPGVRALYGNEQTIAGPASWTEVTGLGGNARDAGCPAICSPSWTSRTSGFG